MGVVLLDLGYGEFCAMELEVGDEGGDFAQDGLGSDL